MNVQIILNSGEPINLDMSWAEVLSGPGRLGEIRLDAGSGIMRIIPKSSIATVYQFTEDAWNKAKTEAEAQKKKQDEQRATQQKAQNRANAEARIKAWHAQPWHKKLGKKCPITLPEEKAPESPKA